MVVRLGIFVASGRSKYLEISIRPTPSHYHQSAVSEFDHMCEKIMFQSSRGLTIH